LTRRSDRGVDDTDGANLNVAVQRVKVGVNVDVQWVKVDVRSAWS